MQSQNFKRRTTLTTLPAIETIQRNVKKVPTYHSRYLYATPS